MKHLTKKLASPPGVAYASFFRCCNYTAHRSLLLRWKIVPKKGKKETEEIFKMFPGYKNICAHVINLPPQGKHPKFETLKNSSPFAHCYKLPGK